MSVGFHTLKTKTLPLVLLMAHLAIGKSTDLFFSQVAVVSCSWIYWFGSNIVSEIAKIGQGFKPEITMDNMKVINGIQRQIQHHKQHLAVTSSTTGYSIFRLHNIGSYMLFPLPIAYIHHGYNVNRLAYSQFALDFPANPWLMPLALTVTGAGCLQFRPPLLRAPGEQGLMGHVVPSIGS